MRTRPLKYSRARFHSKFLRAMFVLFAVGKTSKHVRRNQNLTPELEKSAVTGKKFAYVTLLCDDGFDAPAYTSLHTLAEHADLATTDIIVLAHRSISEHIKNNIRTLGANVINIKHEVPYPFKVTATRAQIHKPCRYSKLLLWTLTQYERIVYFDLDVIFLQSVNDLFLRDELTAVPDGNPPDYFNSGIFVAQPNKATFERMMQHLNLPSYNVGDQGFLNMFFDTWYSGPSGRHLPMTYNAFVRGASFMFWKSRESDLKIIHYTGEHKPWNNIRDIYAEVHGTKAYSSKYENIWLSAHADAMLRISCETTRINTEKGVTVVLNGFERMESLKQRVSQFSQFRRVATFVVIWGNTGKPAPHETDFEHRGKGVNVVFFGRDKITDRFLSFMFIKTEGILIVDDDTTVTEPTFERAFLTWERDKSRLVGLYPRYHLDTCKDGCISNVIKYVLNPSDRYSMVLTKFMFISLSHLKEFMCTRQDVHEYVNQNSNCEDIAMNIMVSKRTLKPPVYVRDHLKVDSGTRSGLSSRSHHGEFRTTCLRQLLSLFNETTMQTNMEAVNVDGSHGPFTTDHFVKS